MAASSRPARSRRSRWRRCGRGSSSSRASSSRRRACAPTRRGSPRRRSGTSRRPARTTRSPRAAAASRPATSSGRRTAGSRRRSTTSSGAATASVLGSSRPTSGRSRRSPRRPRSPAATSSSRSTRRCRRPPKRRSATADLGAIDLRTAVARSCNSFFYELGKRLNDKSADLLPNAAKSFGLGKATDIDYVFEAEGLVPSPAWKQQRFSNPADKVWNPGDATNLAIGQGFMLATPLQMTNYAAALANDGIVWKPRLVIEIRDRSGTTVRKLEKTMAGHANATNTELSLIRDCMRAVVADPDGTVYFPFRGFGVTVAGKSGTAETPSGNPNGWFIGFASFEQPSVAFAAVFEEFKESPGNFASQASGTAVRAALAAKFGLP